MRMTKQNQEEFKQLRVIRDQIPHQAHSTELAQKRMMDAVLSDVIITNPLTSLWR